MADTKMTKSAGEHWVCSVLARYGWGAALTRDGLERTDILAVQTGGPERKAIEVQVKSINRSKQEAKWWWQLGVKSQQAARSDHEWYALVMLDPVQLTAVPRTFIVPRDHIAAAAWIGHRNWQNEPGVPAGRRNPGMEHARVGTDIVADYEDRWDLLGTSTKKSPHHAPAVVPRTRCRPESWPPRRSPLDDETSGVVLSRQ
ncbi:hypothetical protein AB0N24_04555 [Arthrobacter sp. NPDC093128]|uniref:hypothetical protein n=1 Tax=Arthrobacter sp. NPDC093128 TaxID=3154979 RepID=UPI00343E7580